ncbi:MAG: hypothetical protein ACE5RB_05935 [Nitrosopumilus sp.]
MLLTLIISPSFFDNSFAQQMTPHQQWKKFADIDMITCKSGYLLLQKSNGNPVCVMPSTYLKLVDRGYGSHNQSMMEKNPEMMNHLMNSMATNENLMYHWHEMMQKNPAMMMQTMNDWVSQIKASPELLKNMLGPMTSDPELREKMIHTMKNHTQMENHLKSHSAWMDSVHQPMMGSGMGQGMHQSGCMWCSDYEHHQINSHGMMMHNSDKMMDMIHHVWINSDIAKDMHTMMLEDPSHMAMMSNQMMEPMLNAIMDDADLREQMIELMLEHKDFMNSIRHENPQTDH